VDDKRLIDASDLPLERAPLRTAAEEPTPPSVHRQALATRDLLVVAPPAAPGRRPLPSAFPPPAASTPAACGDAPLTETMQCQNASTSF